MSKIKISMGESDETVYGTTQSEQAMIDRPGMRNQFAPATIPFKVQHLQSGKEFARLFDNEFGESTEQLEIRLANAIVAWNRSQSNWVYSR